MSISRARGTETRSAPRATSKPQHRRRPRSSVAVLLAVIAGVALLALVVAIVVTRGSSSGVRSGIEQTRPVTVSGVSLPALPASGTDPAADRTAPVLSGASFDGKAIVIGKDARAKIIVFAAHWCPHCRAEIPVIEKWLDDAGEPDSVDLYAVSTAVNQAGPNYPPSLWLEKWPVTTLADSSDNSAGVAFGVNAYPFFVVVRANGTVALRVTGELTPTQLTELVDIARR
jgi:cytochrome c biogenesis protein CcmG, thiol:disulfide interchange protein DsbE